MDLRQGLALAVDANHLLARGVRGVGQHAGFGGGDVTFELGDSADGDFVLAEDL